LTWDKLGVSVRERAHGDALVFAKKYLRLSVTSRTVATYLTFPGESAAMGRSI